MGGIEPAGFIAGVGKGEAIEALEGSVVTAAPIHAQGIEARIKLGHQRIAQGPRRQLAIPGQSRQGLGTVPGRRKQAQGKGAAGPLALGGHQVIPIHRPIGQLGGGGHHEHERMIHRSDWASAQLGGSVPSARSSRPQEIAGT